MKHKKEKHESVHESKKSRKKHKKERRKKRKHDISSSSDVSIWYCHIHYFWFVSVYLEFYTYDYKGNQILG